MIEVPLQVWRFCVQSAITTASAGCAFEGIGRTSELILPKLEDLFLCVLF